MQRIRRLAVRCCREKSVRHADLLDYGEDAEAIRRCRAIDRVGMANPAGGVPAGAGASDDDRWKARSELVSDGSPDSRLCGVGNHRLGDRPRQSDEPHACRSRLCGDTHISRLRRNAGNQDSVAPPIGWRRPSRSALLGFVGLHRRDPSVPVRQLVRRCALEPAKTRGLIIDRGPGLSYSPGVIRCAVDVPGFMIHTPPPAPLSGSPSVLVVANGTAMVTCVEVCSASAPLR